MANGASRIFKVMQNSGTDTVSELVHLKVKTINPLTFTLDDRVILTEDFVELNSNINKSNLKIDDVLTAFSLNGGQLFFIQQYFSENPISRELPAGGNQGQILSKKSNKDYDAQWIDNNGGATGDTLPIGAVVEFPSDNIPDNWLLCNGQAVSRTDYAELFAAIGTTWGAGDGSTTFNVPTKEGLVTVGKKTSDSDFNEIGKTGGVKTQEHDLNTSSAVASIALNTNGNIYYGETQVTENIAKTYTVATGGSGTNKSISNKWGAKLYGKTSSESNLQPYTTSNFIIKAKQSSGVVATVVDNLNSTSTTDALSAKQGKELNEKISGIIESGSNSNGSYIKFSDGTMICTKKVTGTADITEQYYGNFYHTPDDKYFDLGNYAQEFISVPVLNVTFYGGNAQWIGSMYDVGTLHIAKLHLIAPNSKSADAYYNVIAIGKWK